jgi:hypothetical protein
MDGLCHNTFEGVTVTDELERGFKNCDYGLFLNISLKRIRKETKNVRTVETGIHLSQGRNANDDVQSLNICFSFVKLLQ